MTFVETGTFVGDTTKYVASGHPNLKVLTCEVNPRWYALAKRLCKGLDNIEFFLGESSLFLEQHRGTFESSRTLFWLDAHWGGSWPLFDETKVVSSVSSYALMVDDFEVPGRPMFHYDTYHGVKNCLQAHREFLGDNCLVPDYDPHSSCKNPAGYGLFFKNLDYSRLKTLGSLRKLQAQPISSGGGPP